MKRIGQQIKSIEKEQVWLGCVTVGPLICFGSVYYPALTIVGLILIVIGVKGILQHVM